MVLIERSAITIASGFCRQPSGLRLNPKGVLLRIFLPPNAPVKNSLRP